MDETPKQLVLIIVIFAVFIVFYLFFNLIPSIVEGSQKPEDVEQTLTLPEKVEKSFNDALQAYLEQHEDQKPKRFSDFVSYKDTVPQSSTLNLNQYSELMIEENPVEGLESKTLVLRLNNPETKQKEVIVLLLNAKNITRAEL